MMRRSYKRKGDYQVFSSLLCILWSLFPMPMSNVHRGLSRNVKRKRRQGETEICRNRYTHTCMWRQIDRQKSLVLKGICPPRGCKSLMQDLSKLSTQSRHWEIKVDYIHFIISWEIEEITKACKILHVLAKEELDFDSRYLASK